MDSELIPKRSRMQDQLPPDVSVDLAQDLGSYWRERIRQHTNDSYAGIKLSKLPEDLRTYEHLLWSDQPDTVIEIGTQYGGSALWFRDRLRTLQSYGLIGAPRVVTLDIDQSLARSAIRRADPDYESTISLLEGDIRDPAIADEVRELVGERCFIVEDSAHEYDTTIAALTTFAGFVPPGGYFIVEDGSVDIETLRVSDDWPRGVLLALGEWLQSPTGREFCVRRDLELYGITSHPGGFLQRHIDATHPAALDPSEAVRLVLSDVKLAHPGGESLLERQLGAENDNLRNQVAELNERLGDGDRLQQLLVDAESRLAGIPELQLRIAETERELSEARRDAELARKEAGELDQRVIKSKQVLAEVFNSPSWRLTQPLRTAKHSAARLRDALGR